MPVYTLHMYTVMHLYMPYALFIIHKVTYIQLWLQYALFACFIPQGNGETYSVSLVIGNERLYVLS